jgi:hypothetical protein
MDFFNRLFESEIETVEVVTDSPTKPLSTPWLRDSSEWPKSYVRGKWASVAPFGGLISRFKER